jgi:hypothetical protein
MEDWFRSYDRIDIDLEDVVHLGSGVVFNLAPHTGRLAGSDGEITLRYGSVAVWVDGLIESVTNYRDSDEARAAAARLAESRG